MLSLFLTHLEGYKKAAIKSPILIILEVVCELLLPLVMAEIVDTAIPSKDVGYIFAMGGLMLALALMAMACGVGSGSMMAASSASLAAAFPEMAEQISAYAGTSNVLSNADGVVMTVILGVPMCNWMYNKLYPAIGRGKKEKKA